MPTLERGEAERLVGELTDEQVIAYWTRFMGSAYNPNWREWLFDNFADVATQGLSPRHERLWEWIEALTPGTQPRARIEVWPRGGAKSSTAELGCARVGVKLSRRFALYVSGTQDQADLHVQSIGALFERAGVDRAINKYGSSRGWRRDQLRTANGFNVAAYGLDAAARGVKLDQYRPDLIIFDDVDAQEDSLSTIEKKTRAITTSIIPAGAADCAILFVQNLIHEESIVSQLVDGRADFLLDREVPQVEPAVIGLQTEIVEVEDGPNRYRITDGVATWEGQSLEICEKQINSWGRAAFLREAQHEVQGADGYVFDVSKLTIREPSEVPELFSICLAGDLAATEDGGDKSTLFLMGKDIENKFPIFAAIFGHWSPERVQACIRVATAYYKIMYPKLLLSLPQDPGQAGKAQAMQMRVDLQDFKPDIKTVTGKKATRARGWAEQVNLGNCYFVNQDLPAFLAESLPDFGFKPLMQNLTAHHWQQAVKNEMRKFREDVLDQPDDIIDAGSDSYNIIAAPVMFDGKVATG